MIETEPYLSALNAIRASVMAAGEALHIDHMREQVDELTEEMNQPDFWNDLERSTRVNQRLAGYKKRIAHYERLLSEADDIEVLVSLAKEEDDPSALPEADALELETLMRGDYDGCNAILSLHAGAGGTEAQDWTQMLYRMYTRFCERMGFTVKLLDLLDGDEAGIKSVTFEVSGDYAYGYLKSERGVHRLVRISPFDANARRHTSFASLDVSPIIEDDGEIEIRPEDLRIDTYRASGAGGQHVNRTDSAVRITHLPTGIVVQCQNERSQVQNKEMCFIWLRARLAELKEQQRQEQMGEIKGELKKIEWGSQIRSYVFQPYTMVKDHRTGFETGNIDDVMNGGLDGFTTAYLKMQ